MCETAEANRQLRIRHQWLYYGNDQSKKETIDGHTAVGEYKTLLPDGKRQIVTYESGPDGHQANVAYEDGKSADYSASTSEIPAAPATYGAPAPSYETPAYSEPVYDVVSECLYTSFYL